MLSKTTEIWQQTCIQKCNVLIIFKMNIQNICKYCDTFTTLTKNLKSIVLENIKKQQSPGYSTYDDVVT